jgi:hypothetical protein
MKLASIKIEGRKPAGWESAELVFGRYITELFGPNGCGKTPVIQSIAFALGYPIRYRDDILANCESVSLTMKEPSGELLAIRRRIGLPFDLEVIDAGGGARQAFYNERDYSQFLVRRFGFAFPTLTTTGYEATVPYLSALLPIFYLDQDIGYTSAYKSPTTFIRDQYAEMSRLVFGLPPKHSFDVKKLTIEKKKRLETLDRLIVKKSEQIEGLTQGLGKLRRPLETVSNELLSTRQTLDKLKSSRGARSEAQVALDSVLYESKTLARQLRNEIVDLQSRVQSFNSIQNEIEIEVNTLSLNEEARRLFSSFKDICANAACGLFLGSSDSYGKSLLYLRDQIKDLERNNGRQSERIEALQLELETTERQIADLEKKQAQSGPVDDTAGLVDAIAELTRRIIDLQSERTTLDELGKAESEYVQLLNERKFVQDEIASMEGTAGASDLRALEIRSALRHRTQHWLDILQTKNVSREISVDADFDFQFGPEKLNQLHGSTLLRVVLAIRTAAFEVYARDESKRLRFLVLDTPRQQDIEKEPLARYISELKTLAVEKDAQIIFSTTDYHYECGEGDVQWSPMFDGVEQKMFLRPVV